MEGQIEMSFSLPLGNRDGGHEFPGRQGAYLRVYVEWLQEQRLSSHLAGEIGVTSCALLEVKNDSE